MAEAAQGRVQTAVENLVDQLDRSAVRKMQGDMHRCAASCCDDTGSDMAKVHRCVEDCSKNVTQAQTFIQGELANFQDRLQRCALQCQDNIRDKITPKTSEGQLASYRNDYEGCVVQCADDHVKLIPDILKRMKDTLSANYV